MFIIDNIKAKKIEAKKQKEIETRMHIKQTLSHMKSKSNKFEDFKKIYIEKAKKAALEGNKETYKLAKSGLKNCLAKQKYLDQMIENIELSLDMADMNKVVVEFIEGINLLGEQMENVTSGMDMSKAQLAYEKALANNESQYDALETFLNSANESFENMNDGSNAVSDEEIDKLISIQAADQVDSIDNEIDQKISNVREKLRA